MLRHWNSKYLRIWIALCFIAETVRSVVQARKTYAERNLMRRPLFTVCLCLVTIIAIMRILAGVGTGEDTGLPPDGSPVKITGRIDTRSSEEIILKSISIIQNDQEYSYSGKLQCELENMKTAMITAGAVTEEEKTLKIGQQIVLEGTFALFSTATNPGEFDAQAYYAAKGIGGRFWPQGRSTAFCGKNCMDSGRYCMTGLQKFFLRKKPPLCRHCCLGRRRNWTRR